jgi:hypothetical protein
MFFISLCFYEEFDLMLFREAFNEGDLKGYLDVAFWDYVTVDSNY